MTCVRKSAERKPTCSSGDGGGGGGGGGGGDVVDDDVAIAVGAVEDGAPTYHAASRSRSAPVNEGISNAS